jgi:hypothetical protein
MDNAPNVMKCSWCGLQIDKDAPVVYEGRKAYHGTVKCAGVLMQSAKGGK